MSEKLKAALRALYVEGVVSGMESAAEIASEHAGRGITARILSARNEEALDAEAFFDDEWASLPGDWETLNAVLDAAACNPQETR